MILASDIGGTHTRLAFLSAEGERPKSLVEDIFLKRAVKKASSIWNPLGLVLHHSEFDGRSLHRVQSGQPMHRRMTSDAPEKVPCDAQR